MNTECRTRIWLEFQISAIHLKSWFVDRLHKGYGSSQQHSKEDFKTSQPGREDAERKKKCQIISTEVVTNFIYLLFLKSILFLFYDFSRRTDAGLPVKEELAIFYPPPLVAFKAIFCLRIVSAIWLHITDCDETFNYWEPVRIHQFLFYRCMILSFMPSKSDFRVTIYCLIPDFKRGNMLLNMPYVRISIY